MKIAVVGCCHGELDAIYETINAIQSRHSSKIDLLIICGDFQAIRNHLDMGSLAVPSKFAEMKQFWRYYSGRSHAPLLTLVIGGNHECSNYMSELPYGGWLASNIYFMGRANVVNFGGVRIAGLSGILKENDYMKGLFECPPFDKNTVRSVYHIRNLEVFRLKQLAEGRPIDIFLSHDWPQGIYRCANQAELLRKKPHFNSEVRAGELGNQYTREILNLLQPKYWFSAHHHCKMAALVDHGNGQQTRFLSLDKCLPGRDFMQILDIEPSGPAIFGDDKALRLDPEWMCILKSTDHLMATTSGVVYMPGPNRLERYDFSPTPEEIQSIVEDFEGVFDVPSVTNVFKKTAPAILHETNRSNGFQKYTAYENHQTRLICDMLDIRDPVTQIYRSRNLKLEEPCPSNVDLEEGEVVDSDSDEKMDENDLGKIAIVRIDSKPAEPVASPQINLEVSGRSPGVNRCIPVQEIPKAAVNNPPVASSGINFNRNVPAIVQSPQWNQNPHSLVQKDADLSVLSSSIDYNHGRLAQENFNHRLCNDANYTMCNSPAQYRNQQERARNSFQTPLQYFRSPCDGFQNLSVNVPSRANNTHLPHQQGMYNRAGSFGRGACRQMSTIQSYHNNGGRFAKPYDRRTEQNQSTRQSSPFRART